MPEQRCGTCRYFALYVDPPGYPDGECRWTINVPISWIMASIKYTVYLEDGAGCQVWQAKEIKNDL